MQPTAGNESQHAFQTLLTDDTSHTQRKVENASLCQMERLDIDYQTQINQTNRTRTLRERWKQVSSADSHALSRYMIKEIWRLTTYDKDLSDEKITMLGQQRQIFYLSETTERYRYASQHVGMSAYVRPLSRFIDDIRKAQSG